VPGAEPDLTLRLNGILQPVRITEVLGDVDARTGFADRFVRFRSGNPVADKPALLSATPIAAGMVFIVATSHSSRFSDSKY